jgi:hypothetical protein
VVKHTVAVAVEVNQVLEVSSEEDEDLYSDQEIVENT